MDINVGESVLMLGLAVLLVFLNGFFVLSEFSIVKIRRSRLEELVKIGRPNAKLALGMTHKLDSYLSATQLGITLSSLALGWVGEPAFARLLEYLFADFFGVWFAQRYWSTGGSVWRPVLLAACFCPSGR